MNNFVKKELENKLKNSSGNILGIGLNDKELLDIIDNNKKIISCNILNNNSINIGKDNSKGKGSQTINIKNIKRIFKKKRIDIIICDYKHIDKYLKTFIKDSIYITKGNILIYGKFNSNQVDKITELYNRYNVSNVVKKEKNSYIIEFEVNNIRIPKIKEFCYTIIDIFSEIYDIVTDLLVN